MQECEHLLPLKCVCSNTFIGMTCSQLTKCSKQQQQQHLPNTLPSATSFQSIILTELNFHSNAMAAHPNWSFHLNFASSYSLQFLILSACARCCHLLSSSFIQSSKKYLSQSKPKPLFPVTSTFLYSNTLLKTFC